MPRLLRASPGSRRLALLSGLMWLWALLAVSQAAVTSSITADGTLQTTVIQSGTLYTITGGTRPNNGPNLFHSFDRFGVGTADIVTFTGPIGITNILSRVTGGLPSVIDGRLQATIQGANLYLLNPSGVLFGPNAAFNVSGSFHVSTADFLRFADGTRFFAHLGQASMLTVAAPTAFGFLGNTPAPITMQGTKAAVATERALSVVGGDLTLAGGILQAASGRIQLASVASPGEVTFDPLELAPDLRVDGFARLGRIALSQGANVTASSPAGAGTVLIRGGRLLVDNAFVNANTTGAGEGAPLGIDVRVTEDVVLRNGGQLVASSAGAGRAGNVQVTAGGSVAIVGRSGATLSGLFSQALAGGDVGDIVVSTPTLTMDAGLIQTATQLGSRGNAGNIEVNVGRLTLTNGAQIFTSTRSVGRGGEVLVTASDTVAIAGRDREGFASGLFSQTTASGDAGRIVVSAPTLRVEDGGDILVNTLGDGNAGAIALQVGRLTLTGGGRIDSGTVGAGGGGTVRVTATDTIAIAGRDGKGFASGLFSNTMGRGPGGSVQVAASHLQLRDGGTISANSTGTGDAGSLQLQVGETFRSERGRVTAEAFQAPTGGNIQLMAGSLVQLIDSELTALSRRGREGDITLSSPFIVLAGSRINANAFGGIGGNVRIETTVLLRDPASLISASGTLGITGIASPPIGTLAPLPQAFVNVAELLPARCVARFRGGQASSLVLGGRGGLPLEPGGVLPSPLTIEERLAADPAVIGAPHRQTSAAKFALLAGQEKALPRLGCSQ